MKKDKAKKAKVQWDSTTSHERNGQAKNGWTDTCYGLGPQGFIAQKIAATRTVAQYLFNIGGSSYRPCYVVQMQGVCIMVDCPLEMSTTLNFVPLYLVPPQKGVFSSWSGAEAGECPGLKETQGRVFIDGCMEFGSPVESVIPFSQIDVILVSNYQTILALPFITEEKGFNGSVFATEPTLQLGRLFMEELLHYIQRTPKLNNPQEWKKLKNPPLPLNQCVRSQLWKRIYSRKNMNSALGKIQIVGYNQNLQIYGSVKISPVSSGYAIGSANWVISSHSSKVVCVSTTSTLTTHPRTIDQASLKNADYLIMGATNKVPSSNPDSMLGDICMNVVLTLKSGGNVLLPVYSAGLVYDLFECLSSHLDNQGLSLVPMFFISNIADSSLAYSNIFAEWLSAPKQNKVYLPEEPFPHAFLVKNNRLKHFKSIYDDNFTADYRQPCIVFTGHPSLRFGDVVHFIMTWKSNPLNTIIFTEPEFNHLDALAPYFPMSMKILRCPIDTSLSPAQSAKLIRDLKPRTVVVAEELVKTGVSFDPEIRVQTMKSLDVLTLPLGVQSERLLIDSAMGAQITMSKVREHFVSPVTGNLDLKDNNLTLKEAKAHQHDVFGVWDVASLTARMRSIYPDAKISQEKNLVKVFLLRFSEP